MDIRRFDIHRLVLKPLTERIHDLHVDCVRPLAVPLTTADPALGAVADRIVRARGSGASVIMFMGGHVVRSGVQRYIIDLMERGYITCLAMNGAVMIHDFEFALHGATTESVARYIRNGQFGLWSDTGRINDIVNASRGSGLGLGRAVGRAVLEGAYPHKDVSLLAQAARLGIPTTVHVGIGYDIIHEHPNFDGAASGEASYLDFLELAAQLERLEGGVVMNFGSAVMAPEVYLKALAMVRNAAAAEGREIRRFTTLVCDLKEMPDSFRTEPCKSDPAYYFRPWKTMLVRTVADGGESFYVRGRHDETIPGLWKEIGTAE